MCTVYRGRKLENDWVGPCRVLEWLGKAVDGIQFPHRGRQVALHRDRLAYHGDATLQSQCSPPPPTFLAGPPLPSLLGPGDKYTPTHVVPQTSPSSPNRQYRPPACFRDFVPSISLMWEGSVATYGDLGEEDLKSYD